LFWKPAIPGVAKLTMIATAMPLSSLGEAEHIIDAALIAARAAAVKTLHAPPDPRFTALAELLTLIEQIEADRRADPPRGISSRRTRPRPKRKSRASKSPARSRANAVSPFRAPPLQASE